MSRVFPVAALLLAAAAVGCGRTTPGSTSPSRPPDPPPLPTSLPAEYHTLASHLAQELRASPDDFRDDKGLAEVAAEGHAAVLDLRAIRSADPDITFVASEAAVAYAEGVTRLERINALPKPPGQGAILAQSFVHGLYGNVYAGYKLGADADRKQAAIRDEMTALAAAIEKADAAHLMLPRIAGRYAAPKAASGRFEVNFCEAWNAWGPHDWLEVHNTGGDLEDCTVVVELKGAGGHIRKNVHYVKRWAGNSRLCARYEPGTMVDGRTVGCRTVTGVQALTVSVLSPKVSTDVGYVYTGPEKAKDVAARIALARPHITCRVRDSALGASAGKVAVIDNRLKHPVFQVGVRVTAANGAAVGEFVRARLEAGGSMDVGSLQVSRNLVAGDRVQVWLGEAELLTYTVP